MPEKNIELHQGEGGIALAIRVTPRAKKSEITKVLEDGTIKIRLTSPPVGGKANLALIEFLSKILEVPKSKIEIVAGQKSRKKLVSVMNLDADSANQRILNHLKGVG